MFATALALGLVAVAFILLLLFCRNAPCFCCWRRDRAPPPDADADAAEGVKKKRTVASVVGTEGTAASPANKDDLLISVAAAGGGIELYSGTNSAPGSAGVVV